MRLSDHGNIIGAITDSQNDFVAAMLLDEVHKISLLLGRHAAGDHGIAVPHQCQKQLLDVHVMQNNWHGVSTDYNAGLELSFRLYLHLFAFLQLSQKL